MSQRILDAAPLRFRKMHGLGNDFVVIDARGGPDPVTPALARALADRRRGVGCDQIAVILDAEGADAAVTFLNADGGVAGACGNATRCVADLLMRQSGRAALTLAGPAGPLRARRLADGRVCVDMGPPRFAPAAIGLTRDCDPMAPPLPGRAVLLSMGNTHCVVIVEDADAAPVETRGPRLERDPLFAEGANIGFLQPLSRSEGRLRVWERGAGLTPACGSGACAAAVAGIRLGLFDRRVTLRLDGGALEIAWPDDAAGVKMAGPVAEVFTGELAPGIAP